MANELVNQLENFVGTGVVCDVGFDGNVIGALFREKIIGYIVGGLVWPIIQLISTYNHISFHHTIIHSFDIQCFIHLMIHLLLYKCNKKPLFLQLFT